MKQATLIGLAQLNAQKERRSVEANKADSTTAVVVVKNAANKKVKREKRDKSPNAKKKMKNSHASAACTSPRNHQASPHREILYKI